MKGNVHINSLVDHLSSPLVIKKKTTQHIFKQQTVQKKCFFEGPLKFDVLSESHKQCWRNRHKCGHGENSTTKKELLSERASQSQLPSQAKYLHFRIETNTYLTQISNCLTQTGSKLCQREENQTAGKIWRKLLRRLFIWEMWSYS